MQLDMKKCESIRAIVLEEDGLCVCVRGKDIQQRHWFATETKVLKRDHSVTHWISLEEFTKEVEGRALRLCG